MPTDETAEPEPEAAPETPPETAPAPVEPEPSRPRYRFLAIAAVVCLVISVTTYFVTRDDDPVAVVEGFFTAILDKDVDAALEYVGRIGYGVPFGERAAFLHPDAIADGWRLLDAEYVGGGGLDDYVEVTIGDDESSTTGRLDVSDYGGEWNIVDPFVEIEVSATAFTYVAVNDRRVVTADLYRHNIGGFFANRIQLLPGRYTFFGDAPGTVNAAAPPVTLVPAGGYSPEPVPVAPRVAKLTPEAAAAVQTTADGLIDDCAAFTTPNPAGCPFGLGDFFEAGDDPVRGIHDVVWEVVEHPVLTVDGAIAGIPQTGMGVTAAEPGLIRLTARGEKNGKDVRFRADCAVDDDDLRVALRPDGTPEFYLVPTIGMFGITFAGTNAATCVYKGEV